MLLFTWTMLQMANLMLLESLRRRAMLGRQIPKQCHAIGESECTVVAMEYHEKMELD